MTLAPASCDVWTVGHSTRELDELVAVLRTDRIEAVLDVRRFPGSRRLPRFEGTALGQALDRHGIAYHWIPALGGRRRPAPESENTGWHHLAFRGYADHVATEEFAAGLVELLMIAHGLRSAILCAEILWWRCHRRIIADVLTSLDVRVWHLRGLGPPERHRLAAPARLTRGVLHYASA